MFRGYGAGGDGELPAMYQFSREVKNSNPGLLKANVLEKVLFSRTDFLPWEILL